MIILTLTLLLVVSLAACGGTANTPTPSSSEGTTQSTTPKPDASTSQTPDVSTTPDASSAPDVNTSTPDDTVPMPDGFPENPGDAEFFNFQTDDYALAKLVEVVTNADQEADSGIMLFCFDADGNTVSVVEKWIMASESDATALSQTITDRGNWANQFYAIEGHNQVGNVLFLSWGADTIDYYNFGTKENVLGYVNENTNVKLSDFYFSKP